MKRTTASGNDSNRYTEGDPGLGIPATVVGGEEMNNIQEELCNAIEKAGIALDGANEFQLIDALETFFKLSGVEQANIDIDNNSSNVLIPGTIFTNLVARRVEFEYQIERKTDVENKVESGKIILRFYNGSWDIDWVKEFDSLAGVNFDIVETDLGGGTIQVQMNYTSDDMPDPNYVGKMYMNKGRIII